MLPILLDLPVIKIYTNGVFLVLAFFWGSFLLWKNFLLTSRKEEEIFDGLFISISGGLLLGRVFHVALNFEDFGFSIFKFILINGYPGISIYGFLIGAFVSMWLYFNMRNIDIRETFDYVIPAAFLALGLGKLGSFLSGSEIGGRTNFVLSLEYPGLEGSRHLTSLYEGIIFLIACFLSYKLLFAVRRDKFLKGSNFFFFWWFFSLIFLIIDPLKTDKTILFGFGFNFLLSAVLLLTFTLIFIYHFRSFIFERLKLLKFKQLKNGKKVFKNIHKKEKRKSS
ncbi:MAG: prolipoprotein diacylglyceryl transferase family protein [Patescibacteria group bacterium]